jgi:hypothetical protein
MPLLHLPITLLTDLALVIVLTGAGMRCMQGTPLEAKGTRVLAGCAVGLSIFIAFMFSSTLLGLLQLRYLLPVLALLVWFAWPVLQRELLPEWIAAWNGFRAAIRRDPLSAALLTLLILAAGFNLLYGYAPPTGEDELQYHLSLPALFVHWNRWVITRGIFSSFFPLNGEMLYTGILLLRGALAVKVMVWLTGVMLAVSVYYFARRSIQLSRAEALFAAALLYMSPMTTSYSGVTSVGLINNFYQVVAVLIAWEWQKSRDRGMLLWLAVIAGIGMGFRMYAFPWAAAIALVYLWPTAGFRTAFRYGIIALLLYSPWWIHNYFVTGNPTYPWPLWKGAAIDAYQIDVLPLGEVSYITTWFKLPFITSVAQFIWGMGPLPWALAPFAFLRPDNRTAFKRLAVYTVTVMLILHIVPGVRGFARYYDAAFPWLAILAAAGLGGILRTVSGRAQKTIQASVLGVLIFPGLALSVYFGVQRIPFLIGRESEDQYLQKRYQGHEGFEMFQYLRHAVAPSTTVLRLGDFPSVYAYYFLDHRMLPMSEFPPEVYQQSTPADLARALRARGVDEVLFQNHSFEKEPDGFWRFLEVRHIILRLPPLSAPYFQPVHQTPESVLYRVVG